MSIAIAAGGGADAAEHDIRVRPQTREGGS